MLKPYSVPKNPIFYPRGARKKCRDFHIQSYKSTPLTIGAPKPKIMWQSDNIGHDVIKVTV